MSPAELDPYVYPGTNVLRNLKDLRHQQDIDIFEADAVATCLIDLKRNPIQGPFDVRRLRETHRRIFGKVYPWAGELRKDTGLMAKNRSGFVVAYGPSQNVPGALGSTFAALKAENFLHGLEAGAMANGSLTTTANSTPFTPSGTATPEPCVPLRRTWMRRRAIGSTGLGRRSRRKIASGFTTRATLP